MLPPQRKRRPTAGARFDEQPAQSRLCRRTGCEARQARCGAFCDSIFPHRPRSSANRIRASGEFGGLHRVETEQQPVFAGAHQPQRLCHPAMSGQAPIEALPPACQSTTDVCRRRAKALVSGFSIALMLVCGLGFMTKLMHQYSHDFRVSDDLPVLSRYLLGIAPVHYPQIEICMVLLTAGFAWLSYQSNDSLSTVVSRAAIALILFCILVAAAPLMPLWKGIARATPLNFGDVLLRCFFPALCAVPLWIAFAKHRRCRRIIPA